MQFLGIDVPYIYIDCGGFHERIGMLKRYGDDPPNFKIPNSKFFGAKLIYPWRLI